MKTRPELSREARRSRMEAAWRFVMGRLPAKEATFLWSEGRRKRTAAARRFKAVSGKIAAAAPFFTPIGCRAKETALFWSASSLKM